MPDINAILADLTLEEKGALTAGGGLMSTRGIQRLGIPQINVTDGPNGARGPHLPGQGGSPSTCIPCGSAIGASWSPAVAEQLGTLVGREALERGCRGLLAPTVNMHRSPLAGRNFECYSEDPLLAGRLAAGYVRGVQSNGVFATVKHLVGNDAEFQRNVINSVIDERALRELYLLPFELAVTEGGALGIMTAYNRLNGDWLTEQRHYLTDILRSEWGFQGLVVTDWYGVADTATSLHAGLDLEMPGPGRAFGDAVVDAVKNGEVEETDLDNAVRHLLQVYDRVGALGAVPPVPHPSAPDEHDRAALRAATTETIVLLRNDGILPLNPATLRRIAVIGDHASNPRLMGGGSAQVVPHQLVSPVDALSAELVTEVTIVHKQGVEVGRAPAAIARIGAVSAPEGFTMERFEGVELTGEPVASQVTDQLRMFTSAGMDEWAGRPFSMRLRGMLIAAEAGSYRLCLSQAGSTRVFVAGELVLDGITNPPPPGGVDMWGMASQDLVAEVKLAPGEPVEVVVEYANVDTERAYFRVGYSLGEPDELLDDAVAAAGDADVALVFVGTTTDDESEGRDRQHLDLPNRQVELIRRVAAVNPRTVVVINAGAPVDLSWADETAAVMQCWFGGEEMANAVTDVLLGHADPGGRLPMTIPHRLEHSPSHDNFPGEHGELRYGESIFMGYRGYDHRAIEPRYPFGHGLSYTSFELGRLTLSAQTFQPGQSLIVSVPVTNTGDRRGWEVVQCYVAPVDPQAARPPKELKAFAKVFLEPGESAMLKLVLDDRCFAYWDPGQLNWEGVVERNAGTPFGASRAAQRRPGWRVDPGHFELLVGRSAGDISARCTVEVNTAPDSAETTEHR